MAALTAVILAPVIHAQTSRLGDFDAHGDIGAPKLAGSAAYNPVSQDYVMTAGGTNMWAERDEFHFAWKRMTGDFILQTRVELIGKGVEPHRKAGLMIRAGQDPDAPYADGVIHGDGLTSLQFRRTKGAITEERRSGTQWNPRVTSRKLLRSKSRASICIVCPSIEHFKTSRSGDEFGKAVQPLRPYRRTFAVTLLWSPLPAGWEQQRRPRGQPGERAGALVLPKDLFEHRAILYTSDHQPFSEVNERYQGELLAFLQGR